MERIRGAADSVGDRTLGLAGRDLRIALKEHYGSPEEAEAAIRQAAEEPEMLEDWSTRVSGEPFSFATLPGSLRESALFSTAAAYLAWSAARS